MRTHFTIENHICFDKSILYLLILGTFVHIFCILLFSFIQKDLLYGKLIEYLLDLQRNERYGPALKLASI